MSTKKFAHYTKSESELILGDKSTPVWLQQRWSEGEYSEFFKEL